jgi:hypothetical protein
MIVGKLWHYLGLLTLHSGSGFKCYAQPKCFRAPWFSVYRCSSQRETFRLQIRMGDFYSNYSQQRIFGRCMYLTWNSPSTVGLADVACFLGHKCSIVYICIAFGRRGAAAEYEASKYCLFAMCLSFVSLTLVTIITKPSCLCDNLHCREDGNSSIGKCIILSVSSTSWSQRYTVHQSCFLNFTCFSYLSISRQPIFPKFLTTLEIDSSNIWIQIA